ncbi:MAG: DUF2384 domain-containing protein [bacterium]|nr:DUF2384 domain-containing protein [bacterium]
MASAKKHKERQEYWVEISSGDISQWSSIFENLSDVNKVNDVSLTYRNVFSDKIYLNHIINKGLPFSFFDEIRNNSPFDDKQWSEFLGISLRTLSRYDSDENHVFKSTQSEKILEMVEVISTGLTVFDTEEDFLLYLETPAPALRFEKPINLLGTSYGKELIMDELNNIEHGIFA